MNKFRLATKSSAKKRYTITSNGKLKCHPSSIFEEGESGVESRGDGIERDGGDREGKDGERMDKGENLF